MPISSMNSVIQDLRRAVLRDGAGLGDRELLGRFIERHDEAAIAALVNRHGPMVWRVCRRLLSHHDAEDAFQATFLVLVHKAISVRPREMVGNWLYGVAHQTALQARRTAARRRAREVQVTVMPETEAAQQDQWPEVQTLLDEELSRLPEIYRTVIVLCDLDGRTRKEAARQLGCPEGTVGGRLARARAMLAKRLTQRGVTLSGGTLAAVLGQDVVSAHVPTSVLSSTIKVVTLVAAGQVATTGVISVKVAALTEGVMKAMLLTKLRAALAVVLILGFVATGATILTCRTAAGQEEKLPVAEKPAKRQTNDKPKALKDEETIQGTWQVIAAEYGGDRVAEATLRQLQFRVVFKGNKMISLTRSTKIPKGVDVTPSGWTFVLNEKTSPRQIDITDDGTTGVGIYAFEAGKLKICLDQTGKNRPTSFKTKKGTDHYCLILQKQEKEKKQEKETFTAWGKEVGGLQAGLGFRPGEKRAYHTGETARLVVRVRNVGKEEVSFSYYNEEFHECPPAVTDDEGKPVHLEGVILSGWPKRIEVNLGPGKEVDLCEMYLVLRRASEKGKEAPVWKLFGTGKFQLKYNRAGGSIIDPKTGPDPILSKLATGKLELEVKNSE